MVPEGNRLGGLQVGKAGHDRLGFTISQFDHAFTQALQFHFDNIDFIAHKQANIGGDLVVTRTTGVEFFAGNTDLFGQPRLDIHVHIF